MFVFCELALLVKHVPKKIISFVGNDFAVQSFFD